jgi:hypothetical protein
MNRYSLGDLLVFKPTTDNPYRDSYLSLGGLIRKASIQRLRNGESLPDGYELWITPGSGGAFKVTPNMLTWESNGVIFEVNKNPQ